MTCDSPIPEQALSDYWIEGLDAERVEEHLIACEECALRMRAIVPVMVAARALGETAPAPVLRREQLDELRARGVRVAEHQAVLTGELMWQLDDSDLFVLVVPVDLRSIDKVDIDYCTPSGEVMTVFPDAPVHPGDTELLIACDRHIATAHEAIRFRVRGMVAGVEHVLADCRLRATAPVASGS